MHGEENRLSALSEAPPGRYDPATIWLHWTTAILVLKGEWLRSGIHSQLPNTSANFFSTRSERDSTLSVTLPNEDAKEEQGRTAVAAGPVLEHSACYSAGAVAGIRRTSVKAAKRLLSW
jgi:hypothetical protein